MIWAIIMMIVMVVLNRGGFPNTPVMGFKYWQYLKSDFANNIIFGLFRPAFNLHDDGTSSPSEGIGGDKGRFMSLLTAILVVCYAYSGTEIVCMRHVLRIQERHCHQLQEGCFGESLYSTFYQHFWYPQRLCW